jgi:hypothetical protein
MKVQTQIKAGGGTWNHNQTLVCRTAGCGALQAQTDTTQSDDKDGIGLNHNQTLVRPVPGKSLNHNQTLVRKAS